MSVGVATGVNGTYAAIASSPAWTAMTVCGWFKIGTTQTGTYPSLISPQPVSASYSWVGLEGSTGTIKGYNGAGIFTPALGVYTPGDWVFAALVHNGTNQRTFVSVNGGPLAWADLVLPAQTASTIKFFQDTTTDALGGFMACVRVWSAALTNDQIAREMFAPNAVLATGLYADCPCPNISTLTDNSGNSHPVVITGTMTNAAQPGLTGKRAFIVQGVGSLNPPVGISNKWQLKQGLSSNTALVLFVTPSTSGTGMTVTSDSTGTWTQIGSDAGYQCWLCLNPGSATTTVTFTNGSTSTNIDGALFEVANLRLSGGSTYAPVGGTLGWTTVTPWATNSITPTNPAFAMFMAYEFTSGGFTSTLGGGFLPAQGSNISLAGILNDSAGSDMVFGYMNAGIDTVAASGTWSTACSGHSVAAAFDIAPGPPIIVQPDLINGAVGGTASMTVLAQASAGSLTYQWQVAAATPNSTKLVPGASFTNVSTGTGGTTATYTTASLTAADLGKWFQCIVTDSNGSTTTVPAQLWLTGIAGGTGTQGGALALTGFNSRRRSRGRGSPVSAWVPLLPWNEDDEAAGFAAVNWWEGFTRYYISEFASVGSGATSATDITLTFDAEVGDRIIFITESQNNTTGQTFGDGTNTYSQLATVTASTGDVQFCYGCTPAVRGTYTVTLHKNTACAFRAILMIKVRGPQGAMSAVGQAQSALAVGENISSGNLTPGSAGGVLFGISYSFNGTGIAVGTSQPWSNRGQPFPVENTADSTQVVVEDRWLTSTTATPALFNNSNVTNAYVTFAVFIAQSASSGASLSDSVSEAGTGADSSTTQAADLAVISEAGTGAETEVASFSVASFISEADTGADAVSATETTTAVVSEADTGADVVTGGLAGTAAISEADTGADSSIGTGGYTSVISEADTGADSSTAQAADVAVISEAGAGAETETAQAAEFAVISNPNTGADSSTGTGGYTSVISEADAGADTATASEAGLGSVSEPSVGGDTPTATETTSAVISEADTGADSVSATSSVAGTSTVNETSTGADTSVAQAADLAVISEADTGADTVTAVEATSAVISEADTGADSSTAQAADVAVISEADTAADSPSATSSVAGNSTVNEASAAADSATYQAADVAVISEPSTGADSPGAVLATTAAISEADTGADSTNASKVGVAVISEADTGADSSTTTSSQGASDTEAASGGDSAVALAFLSAVISNASAAADTVSGSAVIGGLGIMVESANAGDFVAWLRTIHPGDDRVLSIVAETRGLPITAEARVLAIEAALRQLWIDSESRTRSI